MASMSKADLLAAVAEKAGTNKSDTERVLDAFLKLSFRTQRGEKVAWPGFGSFATTRRPARVGRNPQTGAPVNIAASTAMKFSASSVLKTELNKSS